MSLFLLFVFLLLQAHQVLPHHHKDFDDLKQQHHSHHHHAGQHPHSHDQSEQQPEGESEAWDLFAHVTHSTLSAEILPVQASGHATKRTDTHPPFLSDLLFGVTYPKIPPDPEYPPPVRISSFPPFLSAFALRGPPAFSI